MRFLEEVTTLLSLIMELIYQDFLINPLLEKARALS